MCCKKLLRESVAHTGGEIPSFRFCDLTLDSVRHLCSGVVSCTKEMAVLLRRSCDEDKTFTSIYVRSETLVPLRHTRLSIFI